MDTWPGIKEGGCYALSTKLQSHQESRTRGSPESQGPQPGMALGLSVMSLPYSWTETYDFWCLGRLLPLVLPGYLSHLSLWRGRVIAYTVQNRECNKAGSTEVLSPALPTPAVCLLGVARGSAAVLTPVQLPWRSLAAPPLHSDQCHSPCQATLAQTGLWTASQRPLISLPPTPLPVIKLYQYHPWEGNVRLNEYS